MPNTIKISKKQMKINEEKLQKQFLPPILKIRKYTNKNIVLNDFFDFKRREGYIPTGYINAEDEIRDLCKKKRVLVHSIIRYTGYQVTGKKIRNKKTFEKAYKALKLNK